MVWLPAVCTRLGSQEPHRAVEGERATDTVLRTQRALQGLQLRKVLPFANDCRSRAGGAILFREHQV